MTIYEFKDLVKMIFIFGINIIISFSITNLLGISNIVVFKTVSAMYGDITWEVIIFLGLLAIEVLIYILYRYIRYDCIEDEL